MSKSHFGAEIARFTLRSPLNVGGSVYAKLGGICGHSRDGKIIGACHTPLVSRPVKTRRAYDFHYELICGIRVVSTLRVTRSITKLIFRV